MPYILLQQHPAPPAGPDQLVFSIDGAMIPLVGGQWTEARTLAVGDVVQDCTLTIQIGQLYTPIKLPTLYYERISNCCGAGDAAAMTRG